MSGYYMIVDVFTAVSIMVPVLWNVTPCNLVDVYQDFGGTSCIKLEVRFSGMRHYGTQKCW
jgi:hypothetical protein